MIKRLIEKQIKENLTDRKAIIIYGARQTGKTTVLESFFHGRDDVIWLNADEPGVRA